MPSLPSHLLETRETASGERRERERDGGGGRGRIRGDGGCESRLSLLLLKHTVLLLFSPVPKTPSPPSLLFLPSDPFVIPLLQALNGRAESGRERKREREREGRAQKRASPVCLPPKGLFRRERESGYSGRKVGGGGDFWRGFLFFSSSTRSTSRDTDVTGFFVLCARRWVKLVRSRAPIVAVAFGFSEFLHFFKKKRFIKNES